MYYIDLLALVFVFGLMAGTIVSVLQLTDLTVHLANLLAGKKMFIGYDDLYTYAAETSKVGETLMRCSMCLSVWACLFLALTGCAFGMLYTATDFLAIVLGSPAVAAGVRGILGRLLYDN